MNNVINLDDHRPRDARIKSYAAMIQARLNMDYFMRTLDKNKPFMDQAKEFAGVVDNG